MSLYKIAGAVASTILLGVGSYLAYNGYFFRPKVGIGKFKAIKHFFYYEMQSDLMSIGANIYRCAVSLYTNPCISVKPHFKTFRFKGTHFAVYYDDPSKLQNPAELRYIWGYGVTEDVPEADIKKIIAADSKLKHVRDIP